MCGELTVPLYAAAKPRPDFTFLISHCGLHDSGKWLTLPLLIHTGAQVLAGCLPNPAVQRPRPFPAIRRDLREGVRSLAVTFRPGIAEINIVAMSLNALSLG